MNKQTYQHTTNKIENRDINKAINKTNMKIHIIPTHNEIDEQIFYLQLNCVYVSTVYLYMYIYVYTYVYSGGQKKH